MRTIGAFSFVVATTIMACNVNISPAEQQPGVASAPLVAREAHEEASDPGQVGAYAIGHTSLMLVNSPNDGRNLSVSVFYPANPASITSSTQPAQYVADAFYGYIPPTPSTLYEALGYDVAYESPTPARGPFPLVMFSVGWGLPSGGYLYLERAASHGYVVAIVEPPDDTQWPWYPGSSFEVAIFNRPRDMSFAITALLGMNHDSSSLLYRLLDPDRIAMAGHSIGGYAAMALVAGDDNVCDEQFGVVNAGDTLPYPAETCVPTAPDRRIKALIDIEGVSQALRYEELARIRVPSLILGQTVDDLTKEDWSPPSADMNARPHAAIDRGDSYRVDVNGADHLSFSNACDSVTILYQIGVFTPAQYQTLHNGACNAQLPPADAHAVTTKYMIAFLDAHLRGQEGLVGWGDRLILSEFYAASHKPTVQVFQSEECFASGMDGSDFTYRPHALTGECVAAPKNPAGYFTSP